MTGFLCPGCGSQRAIHALLHFDVATAFGFNPLLVISLPLIVIGLLLDALKSKNELLTSLHKMFFGQTVVYSSLVGIIAFWVLRNF